MCNEICRRLISHGLAENFAGFLAFFWEPTAEAPRLKLAPVYDMLPMALAPAANGMLPERTPARPKPSAALLAVWDQAVQLAREFRMRVATDDRISPAFKALIRAYGFEEPA